VLPKEKKDLHEEVTLKLRIEGKKDLMGEEHSQ
jgi:hypothetical protein